jgi:hypothetical protein
MIEKVYNIILNLVKSILTFFKILLRSGFFPKKHKTSETACIILGNGPSLKNILVDYGEALKTHTLICVNKFPDTEHFSKLKPRYFIIASSHYWEKDTIDPNTPLRHKIIEALVDKADWNITMFCPLSAKVNPNFLSKIKQNPKIELILYNNTPAEGLKTCNHFFFSRSLASPRPHNVLIPSILVAINSGFKNIYLVGADHSWLPQVTVNENNEALVNQKHFYDFDESKSDIMYIDAKKPRRLHQILEKFTLSFKSYFELKDYADSKGVNIYNCTEGSYIDAFERKDFSSVLVELKKEIPKQKTQDG